MDRTIDSGIRPQVLIEIQEIARKNQIKRLILYGSRARGDFKERSDIDLAFIGGNSTRFIFDLEENTSTLLHFDIVDLNVPVQKDLVDSIQREGIIIYEKI